MMFKKRELPTVEPVKIKPLFGMQPGKWLTIAYSIAFVLILFLIGILPDLVSGSKRVNFTSSAYNAAVYVDDVYQGGTPFTRRIPSGEHSVTYKINDVELDSFTIKVGHPVFFNWLFRRTMDVTSTATLNKAAFEALNKELLEDANAYGAITVYDSVHRYADIYTNYAKSIADSPYKDSTEALQAAMLFATTDEMYKDALNASQLLGKSFEIPYGKVMDGDGVIGTADKETPAVSAKATSLTTEFFTLEGFSISEADFSNGTAVKASYPEVREAGKMVHTKEFNIGSYAVTEYQYARFIAENPSWDLGNKETLIESKLVDDYYLDGVTLSLGTASNKPVRNVSYYAAVAFCQWLSSVSGKTVSLATENQWIAASLTDSEGGFQRSLMPSDAAGSPAAMLGGVWEMTGTSFVPMARLTDIDITEMLKSYDVQVDMVVKGGSYINSISDITRYSVGVTYRSLCSDYMGFRVAWN